MSRSQLDHEQVNAWLMAVSPRDLLPPRRRDATAPPMSARPADLMSLGVGLALAVAGIERGFVIVPVAGDAMTVRRAVAGDGVYAAILGAIRAERGTGAFRGEAFGRAPDLIDDAEVAIDVDQSNDSIIVGGRAVVKLFPIASPGPHPGLDLPVHLASVGFTSLPAPLGALRWTSPGDDDLVLATASTFLPGAKDGWDWYLDLLVGWLDGEVDDLNAFEPATTLGGICAHMHAAFATASEVFPEPVSAADAATADGWRRSAFAVADEALEVTDGPEGARLAARTEAIRAELDRLGRGTGAVTTQVHGDFHVGQVLQWQGGYAIADFDGNPTAAAAVRGFRDTPVRDVAAFVRSIDHLGRVAQQRRLDRDDSVERWIAASRARFLDAYVRGLDELDASSSFEERLLRPIEVAQACHEYVYAARYLPRWRSVADRAMRALIPMEDR